MLTKYISIASYEELEAIKTLLIQCGHGLQDSNEVDFYEGFTLVIYLDKHIKTIEEVSYTYDVPLSEEYNQLTIREGSKLLLADLLEIKL